ncbi:MAG: signal peptide peptidase SppA [Syntrophaceae bacterium]
MRMRKHPIILGIVLLVFLGISSFIFAFAFSYVAGDRGLFHLRDKVAVVSVKGIITDSKSPVEQIKKYSEDGDIKALVVRIDSPGGGVAASQEIYDSIITAKKKKKVVASMGSVAASGGYYIACAADKIVANPGTVTGSIGAIMHFSNVEELVKKVGYKSSVVKSGRYKDIGSPFRDMTESEKQLIQSVIDDIYDQFLDAVSASRNIPKDELRTIADGRIITGRQALGLRLIDSTGDLESAINLASELSGIKGKPEVIYPKEKVFNFWKYVADEMTSVIYQKMKEEVSGAGFYLISDIPQPR